MSSAPSEATALAGGGRQWLSPETLLTPQLASCSSDVYMLGGVLLEIMTGTNILGTVFPALNQDPFKLTGHEFCRCVSGSSGGKIPYGWLNSKEAVVALRTREEYRARSVLEVRVPLPS